MTTFIKYSFLDLFGGYDILGVCLRNCAQCKKMFGNFFEGQLCADSCVKFKGKVIPDCEDLGNKKKIYHVTLRNENCFFFSPLNSLNCSIFVNQAWVKCDKKCTTDYLWPFSIWQKKVMTKLKLHTGINDCKRRFFLQKIMSLSEISLMKRSVIG